MKTMAAVLGGLMMATVSGAALAQVHTETFDANSEWSWDGELKFESGRMSLCTIKSPYDDNSVLMFMLDRDRDFMMGLVDPDWGLKKDTKDTIKYWVDNHKPKNTGTAFIVDESAIVVDLPESDALYEQLRMGNKLHFEFQDEEFWYGLNGTKKALEALWA
ncbi:MAG TPA: hypothetical protein VGE72_18945, partial [Azospirillum sp.]